MSGASTPLLNMSHKQGFLPKWFTSSKCKCLFKSMKQTRCLCVAAHTRKSSVLEHLLSAVTSVPFLWKLFDHCDSFKQNGAACVVWANFPLYRWHLSVYFSFLLNGRPFEHPTPLLSVVHHLIRHCALFFL